MFEVDSNSSGCGLSGSNLCSFLGCDGCETCVFKDGMDKKTNSDHLAQNWDVTLSYLPADIDTLHETDICVFCGKRHADAGYAELSLAHPEPEHKKGMILGLGKKVRMPVGSLIDIPIAVCKSCKRSILMKDIIQLGGGILAAAIAVAVILIPGVQQALERIFWAGPIVLFALIIAAGWTAVYFIAESYQKKAVSEIYANPLEIPVIAQAVKLGWFPIPEPKNSFARVHFVKQKRRKNFRYFPR